MRTVINNPNLPRSSAPHSNAVKLGNLIFVSGWPGYDKDMKLAKGDFGAQMRQALENVKATLEYAGSSLQKIGKVNVYLDRRSDFEQMNEIYREYFGNDPNGWPARTTIECRLPRPDFLLEERHALLKLGKAGRTRHRGRRPQVRGSVMNPVDHPHGGGEGKASIGMPGPKTPWGKPALGYRTRNNKRTDNMIQRRRSKGRR